MGCKSSKAVVLEHPPPNEQLHRLSPEELELEFDSREIWKGNRNGSYITVIEDNDLHRPSLQRKPSYWDAIIEEKVWAEVLGTDEPFEEETALVHMASALGFPAVSMDSINIDIDGGANDWLESIGQLFDKPPAQVARETNAETIVEINVVNNASNWLDKMGELFVKSKREAVPANAIEPVSESIVRLQVHDNERTSWLGAMASLFNKHDSRVSVTVSEGGHLPPDWLVGLERLYMHSKPFMTHAKKSQPAWLVGLSQLYNVAQQLPVAEQIPNAIMDASTVIESLSPDLQPVVKAIPSSSRIRDKGDEDVEKLDDVDAAPEHQGPEQDEALPDLQLDVKEASKIDVEAPSIHVIREESDAPRRVSATRSEDPLPPDPTIEIEQPQVSSPSSSAQKQPAILVEETDSIATKADVKEVAREAKLAASRQKALERSMRKKEQALEKARAATAAAAAQEAKLAAEMRATAEAKAAADVAADLAWQEANARAVTPEGKEISRSSTPNSTPSRKRDSFFKRIKRMSRSGSTKQRSPRSSTKKKRLSADLRSNQHVSSMPSTPAGSKVASWIKQPGSDERNEPKNRPEFAQVKLRPSPIVLPKSDINSSQTSIKPPTWPKPSIKPDRLTPAGTPIRLTPAGTPSLPTPSSRPSPILTPAGASTPIWKKTGRLSSVSSPWVDQLNQSTTSITSVASTASPAPGGTRKRVKLMTVEEILAGTPDDSEWEKIDQKAIDAAKWTDREIGKVIGEIVKRGHKDDNGDTVIEFGKLFTETANLFDALSGILKTSKKYKVIDFEGEQLWQGRDDSVIIKLLKDKHEGIKLRRRRASALVIKTDSQTKSQGFGHAFSGGGTKCVVCTKTVYQSEYVGASGKSFHKACFRCLKCKKILNVNNYYVSADRNFRCEAHHKEYELQNM